MYGLRLISAEGRREEWLCLTAGDAVPHPAAVGIRGAHHLGRPLPAVVFRVIAASLAFVPAMVFGIFAVNKYYDYYQTWGALYSDLSGRRRRYRT